MELGKCGAEVGGAVGRHEGARLARGQKRKKETKKEEKKVESGGGT
jgi:hypothetical protein